MNPTADQECLPFHTPWSHARLGHGAVREAHFARVLEHILHPFLGQILYLFSVQILYPFLEPIWYPFLEPILYQNGGKLSPKTGPPASPTALAQTSLVPRTHRRTAANSVGGQEIDTEREQLLSQNWVQYLF